MNPDLDLWIARNRGQEWFNEPCARAAFLAGMRWSAQMAHTILASDIKKGEPEFAKFIRQHTNYVKKHKDPLAIPWNNRKLG